MNMKQVGALRRDNQAGFTLIELIVVIVILGILAATALPKFADMGKDARSAKVKAAAGAVASAASIVHAKWLVEGSSSTATTVTLESGSTVAVVAGTGYPEDSAIAAAAGITSDDFTITAGGTSTTIFDKTKNAATCGFTYSETLGAVSSIVVSGC